MKGASLIGNSHVEEADIARGSLLVKPPSEEEKADNVYPEEPPDDSVDHHHGKDPVNPDQVLVEAEKNQDQRQVEPQ